MSIIKGPDKYRFFVCRQGSITDLEEIYSISTPFKGYGEYASQWQFKAIAKLDGKPLQFVYDDYDECLKDQQKMAGSLVRYKLKISDSET